MFPLFVQVLVYKDGSLQLLFLCAVKFQHCPASLLQHITNIGCHLSADESAASQHDLLSFVPMSSLRGIFLFVLWAYSDKFATYEVVQIVKSAAVALQRL